MMDKTLAIALKEWAVTCEAMLSGELVFLVRKGGIHERRGRFAIEHERFWLFPGHEHQRPDLLKDPWKRRCAGPVERDRISLDGVGQLVEVRQAPPRLEQAGPLIEQGIWSEEFFRVRYAYRPELPLYVIVLRTYRSDEPRSIANLKRYAGCRSWVPLGESVTVGRVTPVLPEKVFQERREALMAALG